MDYYHESLLEQRMVLWTSTFDKILTSTGTVSVAARAANDAMSLFDKAFGFELTKQESKK